MTKDDIKFYLESMDWPEADKGLADRVMLEITPVVSWALVSKPARYTFAAGTAICLLAGYFAGHLFVPAKATMPFYTGSQNLLYHFSL
jgi:hypothetical protein